MHRRASDVAMQALAYFADRARLSHSHKDFDPSAVDLIASSSALEDFLLFLCTYRCGFGLFADFEILF